MFSALLRPVAGHRRCRAAVALALCAALSPAAVAAQRAPLGLGILGSTTFPAEQLGAGNVGGLGLVGQIGLSSAVALEGSVVRYPSAWTERGDLRSYRLTAPALGFRTTLRGSASDFALFLGGGLQRFQASASGGSPAERIDVPSAIIGLSGRFHVWGPVGVDVSGRDWLGFVRAGEMSAAPGAGRGISHSPEFRIALMAFYRRAKPTVADPSKQAALYDSDFKPVSVADVPRRPEESLVGRDHIHTDGGTSIGIKVVDAAELAGAKEPSGVSVIAPTVPLDGARRVTVGTVFFAKGSHTVRASYRAVLGEVAAFLGSHPETRLALVGFTDDAGNDRINQSVAEERGTAVQELLVRVYGIAQERITVTGIGPDFRTASPTASRRVDLVLIVPAQAGATPEKP